ncbi:heterokaryon incompatibility protein (HET) domain-containing protein [Trichoderma breve]|uniref:Heterokaryon incompatibility protein (HET) domain-containing protein n=1 Tax=Trichoderma breve TaxID=2034170 RepID=A0A9W9B4X7_9HYPO|nr:heterokaryon incompatibility protein (HET) domain-containing protein [Trichoderma breve]KAJ4855824.1 heterokaryon incompatibility protein (HET) domain-containing protein [Trichoderma breve]
MSFENSEDDLGGKENDVAAISLVSGQAESDTPLYQPLDDRYIRLLKLLPGSGPDPIRIQLQSISLEDPGPYTALSYVWGDAEIDRRTIYSGDTEQLSVTANLFHVLCRFRDVSETRTWWIDALCIDQSSISERNQQVAKARHEYARSKHIIELPGGKTPVYLYSNDLESMKIVANVRDRYASRWVSEDARRHYGSPDSDPKMVTVAYRDLETGEMGETHGGLEYVILALDFDKSRVQKAEKESLPDFCTFLLEAIKPAEFDLTHAQCVGLLHGLDYIASRPYWRRAWVIQEAIVSEKATLVCGKHEIDFDVFCTVYGYGRAMGLDVKNVVLDDVRIFDVRSSLKMLIRQSKQMRDLTLGHLMGVFGGQLATDPRDLIFSLSIDYSLDVQAVFKNAAKHIVDSYPKHRIDNQPRKDYILSFVKFDPSKDTSLPTWIPNWTCNRGASNVLFAEDDPQIDVLIEYDAKVEGDYLVLSGHIVDTVTMSIDIGQDEDFYNEVDLYNIVVEQNLGTRYGSQEARFEAFWRAIVADNPIGMRVINGDDFASLKLESLRSWITLCSENYQKLQQIWPHRLKFRRTLGPMIADMKAKNKQTEKPYSLPPGLLDYVPMETIEELLNQENDPVWSSTEAGAPKQFIITEHGFFGTGLPGVEVGDVVAILAGSGNPWYLRKQGNHFIVIGKGWIHGLMYRDDEYHRRDWSDKIVTILLR